MCAYTKKNRWKICNSILSSNLENNVLILSLENGCYFSLDTIGSYIWQFFSEKPVSLDEIVDKLLEEYDIDRETCLKDVQEFIDDMASKKLIIPVEQENPPEK